MNPISQRPICLEGRQLTYVLERKAVKNINLRVRPDLSIYVSAGPRVPIEHIEAFLQKQGPFIVKALDEYACRKALPVLTLRDGDGLYVAGTACTLDVRLGLRNTVRRRGRTVFMELADNTLEERRHLYHELLRREGEKLFAESLARIFPQLSAYGIANRTVVDRAELEAGIREMIDTDGPFLLQVAVIEEGRVLPMCCPGNDVDDMVLDY